MANQIAQRLAELGMTQAELASKTGLSTGFISDLVNGHRGKRVGATVAQKLATALDTDTNFLLSGFSNAVIARARRPHEARKGERRVRGV